MSTDSIGGGPNRYAYSLNATGLPFAMVRCVLFYAVVSDNRWQTLMVFHLPCNSIFALRRRKGLAFPTATMAQEHSGSAHVGFTYRSFPKQEVTWSSLLTYGPTTTQQPIQQQTARASRSRFPIILTQRFREGRRVSVAWRLLWQSDRLTRKTFSPPSRDSVPSSWPTRGHTGTKVTSRGLLQRQRLRENRQFGQIGSFHVVPRVSSLIHDEETVKESKDTPPPPFLLRTHKFISQTNKPRQSTVRRETVLYRVVHNGCSSVRRVFFRRQCWVTAEGLLSSCVGFVYIYIHSQLMAYFQWYSPSNGIFP